eukprot:5530017-Pyramimonas_sp.AAC.1
MQNQPWEEGRDLRGPRTEIKTAHRISGTVKALTERRGGDLRLDWGPNSMGRGLAKRTLPCPARMSGRPRKQVPAVATSDLISGNACTAHRPKIGSGGEWMNLFYTSIGELR